MKIAFKPKIKVTGISSTKDDSINLHFNVGNEISFPKSILDLIYMLNGQFTVEHITMGKCGRMDIDSHAVIDKLLDMEIIHEAASDNAHAICQLSKYTAHFPKMSNVNVMIAALLQKMGVRAIFYENGAITRDDVNKNIYYKLEDVGKDIVSFMKDEMSISTVCVTDDNFNPDRLDEDIDIVVNSDASDWANEGDCITINTWNYGHMNFNDFNLSKAKKDRVNVSDDLKPLIDGYILAVRSVDDMLYSVAGALSF